MQDTVGVSRPLRIPLDGESLKGDLVLPSETGPLVVFAHGSGSSRHSPRNQYVAQVLQEAGIGTLLFDLLTPREDADYQMRFDIALLTQRLMGATRWLRDLPQTRHCPLGYFGASTGAAAALWAAAELGPLVRAVVSRGGRPDLALEVLDRVQSPTLLLVGGWDQDVLELNEKALARLQCPKQLHIVPEATHLFEEPGKLEEAASFARQWFQKYLG